jgi:DNA-binding transcriptional LysR family regulator
MRQIGVLVALVEQGSFGRAAKSLGLSQSTVSGHVADLERRLGTRLVERDRRGVLPTAAGRALLPHAREALRAEANARRAVQDLTGLLTGTLAVGGSSIPAAYLLPGWIAGFHQRHPQIAMQLVTGDSEQVLTRVRNGDVEIAVVGTRTVSPGLHSVEVGDDRLVLIAPAGHPLTRKRAVTLADVAVAPLVVREEGSGTRTATLRALAAALGNEGARSLRVVLEVGSTEAQKASVRSGLGVAFVSHLAVRGELASKALVQVPVEGMDARRSFYLVTREEAHLSPAARAFRDHVLSEEPAVATPAERR